MKYEVLSCSPLGTETETFVEGWYPMLDKVLSLELRGHDFAIFDGNGDDITTKVVHKLDEGAL